MAAHDIPYAAQASMSHWNDLYRKAKKAFAVDGPAFLNVSVPAGWAGRLLRGYCRCGVEGAVQCNVWPLYEVEQGKWKLTFKRKALPVAD